MIELASVKYLEKILEIERMVFRQPWSRDQLKTDILSENNVENWIYIDNGNVVGYILGRVILNEFHLNNIAVHTDFQSRHIGRDMVKHVIDRLKKNNINNIYLEVSIKNNLAQKLYKSFGFNKYGFRKDYYANGDHALLYNLELNSNG